MKSLLVLTLLSVVLIGLVGYAEAYDGKIRFDATESDITIGDIVFFKGMLIGIEPEPNAVVNVVLHDMDGNIIHDIDVKVDSQMLLFENEEQTWNFDFIIDTSKYDLLTDTQYIVEATFEDKINNFELIVYPTLEQSIIDAGIAQTEKENAQAVTEPIPEWVRNIFIFYANNEISDSELMGAIQYLIDVKILKA